MISHNHKIIFIHIPKAAGQSVEHVFLSDLGLSWAERLPLLLGSNICNTIGPPMLAHLLARDYYKHNFISRDLFDKYIKFSIVRNPFTRIVSTYTYLKIPTGFDQFVTEILPHKLWFEWLYFVRPQIDYLCDEAGCLLIDDIFRFENLNAVNSWLRIQLGKPSVTLPHINKSPRRFGAGEMTLSAIRYGKIDLIRHRRDSVLAKSNNYNALFASRQTRRVIEELYKDDLDIFNYDFVQSN